MDSHPPTSGASHLDQGTVMLPIVALSLLTGCHVYNDPFDLALDAAGVDMVVADIDRGSFGYWGHSSLDSFAIEGESTGSGSSEAKARARAEANDWQIDVEGNELVISTSSRENGRVNLDVDGPVRMHTDLILDSGGVYLEDVEGSHMITADSVETRDLVGDLDLYSRSGSVDVEIYPWEDHGRVYIEAHGTTTLRMPAGLDYDIEVWGDPEYAMTIEDLYFYNSYMGEGYFSAESGSGTVEVDVWVYNGSFTLYETR